MTIEYINRLIDDSSKVYLWIETTKSREDANVGGKYVEVPKAWMKQLIEGEEFSGYIDWSVDVKTGEVYFH